MAVTQSIPGDLLGGAVELYFDNGNGKMISLGQVAGVNNTVNFVEQVKVKITLGAILQMDITLDPPIDQAITLLRSGRLGIGFSAKKHQSKTSTPQAAITNQSTIDNQQANNFDYSLYMNKVALRLHYGGLSSAWFRGLLLQPEIDISVEGISITLKAIGMLFTSHKSLSPITFQAQQTKQQAIEALLGSDVVPVYDPEAMSRLRDTMNTTKQTYTGKTHLEHARDIAATVGCKIIQIGGDAPDSQQKIGIYHVSKWRNDKSPPAATFVAYRQINPQNREFPLISFSCSIQNLMLGPFSGVTIAKGTKKIDISQNSTQTYSEKRGQAVGPSDGSVAGALPMGETSKQGDTAGTSKPDQARQLLSAPGSFLDTLNGYYHDFVDKAFEFELTSIGVVDLLPGNLVGVAISNISELTSKYDIYEVEHTISSSGVETRVKVVRTAGLISMASQGIEEVKNNVRSKFGSKPPKTPAPNQINTANVSTIPK
jgi:hypothetical protein